MLLLDIKNLVKKFNTFTAVDNVSLQAKSGEVFGLLGPNGAGKTTTIRVIATVLQATSGTAEVAGFDISRQSKEVRQNVGVLTTEIGVYERFTGRENLRYFGELYGLAGEKLENRINELIDLLDMRDFADKRSGKYSTGMKQKLAIARSVIHDPKVIIFDEPTAGLDVLASQTVMRFIQRVRGEGRLVILSTHEMADAEKLCDRVAIMHKGRIIAVDTVAAIKQHTRAVDLESAFVNMIRGDQPAIIDQGEKKTKGKRLSSFQTILILRITAIVLIVFGFLGNFLGWYNVTIGYGLAALGIILSFIAKRFQRKVKNL
ncbi:MAG: ATP-binding cassette domain-containing protein [Patescibacteria group bacterium]|nr:ATP-binding cassette domain-containing protein [Patescibacteria group bacterium]